jgi:uncharacterized RDD family membrane protein YckC
LTEQKYAGFWIRTAASLIDTVLFLLIIVPVLMLVYGADYWDNETAYLGVLDVILQNIFPVVAVLAFWIYKSATPGKMVTKLIIVDAETGGKPSTGKFIIRYIGYILASIPFGLGLFWVAIDKRKRGWHDMLAGTVVIRQEINPLMESDNTKVTVRKF